MSVQIEQYVNDPGTTLASAITSTSATTLDVASSTGYPSGDCNFSIGIDSELLLVTNVSGTTWTVARGQESTSSATHLIGANVNATLTKRGLLNVVDQRGWNLLSAEDRVRAGGAMTPSKGKDLNVTNTGGTRTVLNNTSGPGYLTEFFLAVGNYSSGTSDKFHITCIVDGTTIYDGSLGGFFAAPYFTDSVSAKYANDFTQIWGGTRITYPIPFGSSLEIIFTNNHTATVPIWWTIGVITGAPLNWPRCNQLFIANAGPDNGTDTSLSLTQDQVGTLVNASGLNRGRIAGIFLVFNGAACNNNFFLEGNIQIYLDGVLAYQSSGIEDYMGAADYFIAVSPGDGNRFQSLILKQPSTLYAFVRFHIHDPMLFDSAFEVKLMMGDSVGSGVSFTGACLLAYTVWYYTE